MSEARGSLWRRWDLHVHTPESALENHFTDWGSYIAALEAADPTIKAVALTDYCSIEGYKKAREYKDKGRLTNLDLLLPNIEFRTHPETAAGKGINIHVLLDASAEDAVEQIERGLRHLKYHYDGVDYTCATEELRALGKAVDPSQTDLWGQFKVGVNAFKPDFDKFRTWLANEGRWLRSHGLVAIANGKDGPSGLSKDAGFAATRDELYRLADIIFSGNPADRAYFLGRGSDSADALRKRKGGLKPCVHGSDAHAEGKLFEPKDQRYCWIKADTTFEGLRQVVHEPEDRVVIGPTPPAPVDLSKVIDKVEFLKHGGWFATPAVPLNSGLVGIIGEKGSGKTALAELIAFACTDLAPGRDNTSSFIHKAGALAAGMQVRVTWGDGRTSQRTLGQSSSPRVPEVRYLSQDFVEELCSKDVTGKRLVGEIEQVVFSHIGEADRLDAANFAALRRLRTEHILRRKDELKARLSTINSEIVDLENQLLTRAAKDRELSKATGDLLAIDTQLPTLQNGVDAAVSQALESTRDMLRVKTGQLTTLNRRLTRIQSVRASVADYERHLTDAYMGLEPLLKEIGLNDAEAAAFRFTLPDGRMKPFDRLEAEAKTRAAALRGDSEAPSAEGEAIADLQAKIADLEGRLASDQQQRDRLLGLQAQRVNIAGDQARLEKELKRLDETVTKRLAEAIEERWSTYLSYFGLVAEEQAALSDLYAPLKKVIAEDPTGAKAGFELSVRVVADVEAWLSRGLDLVDKRRADVPLTDPAVTEGLETSLFAAWREGDAAAVRVGLQNLVARFGQPAASNEMLVTHADRRQLYDWLFSTEHVRLDYSLRFQGAELEALSPGTRGIVLLVLYLAMDKQDRRPLIIDQPEGNLDNASLYQGLVPFIRQAKLTRQVILVSHNPNLVVTTDADQVIVADARRKSGAKVPQITYRGGSLEHIGEETATRNQTVRLLEGGSRPFKMREVRYDLPKDDGTHDSHRGAV